MFSVSQKLDAQVAQPSVDLLQSKTHKQDLTCMDTVTTVAVAMVVGQKKRGKKPSNKSDPKPFGEKRRKTGTECVFVLPRAQDNIFFAV